MRIARTLSLYVMRETLLYCTLAFVLLTIVLLTQNLLRRLGELFLVGMTLADVVKVVEYIIPVALSYSIPLAFLLGLLLAVRRLSADGELLGLRSAGIGPVRLLMPFLVLGLAAACLSGWLINVEEHQSRRELVKLFQRVAARGAIIEPGKFRYIGHHLIFVEDRERDGSLSGVMIYDQSRRDRAYRVFATRGQYYFDEATSEIQLDLQDGDVHIDLSDSDPRRYERIRFEEFSYRLDVGHLIGMDWGPVRPKQMSVAELRAVLARAEAGDPLRELDQKDPLEYTIEIHRRRSLPFAPLVFAGIGVPIALASEHRGRNLGTLLVLVAAFGYYALGTLCQAMTQRAWLDPALASWTPNLVFGAIALALIHLGRKQIPGMTDSFDPVSVCAPGFRLLVAPEHAARLADSGLVDAAGFDSLHERAPIVPGGRGDNHLVPPDEYGVAIRIRPARHGGWLASLLGDRFPGPGRIMREFRLWRLLRARGVPLPEPIFAASRRRGPFWVSSLASREHPRALDGAAWLASRPTARALDAACVALAGTLRSLHDAGALHGDLHLRNLLFEPRSGPTSNATPGVDTPALDCWLIDLDRAQLEDRPSPSQRMREWTRLARSLEKTGREDLLTPRLRARLLGAYCHGDRALRRSMLGAAPREARRTARHRLAWRLSNTLSRAALLYLLLLVLTMPACSPDSTSGASAGAAAEGLEQVPRRSLLAVGDTGRTRSFARFVEGALSVADAMVREAKDEPVDALVLLGDNFYWNGLDRQNLVPRIRTNLVRPYCYFLRLDGPRSDEVADACARESNDRSAIPIFAVLGNHDIELPESAELQRQVLPEFLPDWQMSQDLAQVFELGDGISLILFESEPSIDDREAIGEAIRRAVLEARGPWRILATHRPIATDDKGRPRLGGYPSFVRDALAAAGRPVQLALTAHHHNLQVFELGPPTPMLHVGVGSGARAEPPLAQDHPDARFGRLALGFARIDLLGDDDDQRLAVSLIQAPRWPLLSWFQRRRVARFEVDLEGRIRETPSGD